MQKLCGVCKRQQFSASLDYFVTSSPPYLHQFSTISCGNCINLPPPPPPPPDHLHVCNTTRPSFTMSVCPATSPSVILPAPTVVYQPVSQSHCPSIPWPVCPSSQTIRHCLHICTPSYHVHQAVLHCLTIHPPSTPICQTVRLTPTICMTNHPIRQTTRNCHTISMMHQSVHQHVHHKPTV